MELLSPDGYYTYLGVPKPPPSTTTSQLSSLSPSSTQLPSSKIDEDVVKKNYRKLSLRHHPDKAGGDVDTFRVLNRAQKVLTNPKLRQQYDILGIDLDDDEEEQHANDDGEHHQHHDTDEKEKQTVQGSIIQEIASNVLTGVIQVGVRTSTSLSRRVDNFSVSCGILHRIVFFCFNLKMCI